MKRYLRSLPGRLGDAGCAIVVCVLAVAFALVGPEEGNNPPETEKR